jgi:hypothetical protein
VKGLGLWFVESPFFFFHYFLLVWVAEMDYLLRT